MVRKCQSFISFVGQEKSPLNIGTIEFCSRVLKASFSKLFLQDVKSSLTNFYSLNIHAFISL